MRRDGLLHSAFMMFLGSLLAWGFVDEAWATDVTLRLLDQNGALIPASRFDILTPPGGTVQQGGTISLPDGTYSIRLWPGIDGAAQTSHLYLYRDETVMVSGSAQTIDFVWVTATLQLNLVDQNNIAIPGSQFSIYSTSGIPNGGSLVLPVTDDPNTSPMFGPFANGYVVRLMPGLHGVPQLPARLFRNEPDIELTASGAVRTFTWVMATLQVNLVDQNNIAIPASQFELDGRFPNGTTLTLPVTDDPATSPISGAFENGYNIARLLPGLDGRSQTHDLWRYENDVELIAGGIVKTFTWVTATIQLKLLDQNNVLYPACQFAVGGTDVLTNNTPVVLPVTDDPNSPAISGIYANGYDVTVFPGIDGRRQAHLLQRTEPAEELTAAGSLRTFVWVTTTLRLQLFDQNNVLFPVCQFWVAGTDLLTNDASVVFPVTDDPNTPPITGTYANGYEVGIFPGINGIRHGSLLQRTEPAEELTAAGSLRTFVWVTATLRLQLFDQNNVLYPACQFFVAGTDLLTNDASVVFPVTDDPNTPPISGTYANGYEVVVLPGINGQRQAGFLERTEPVDELTATGLLRTFVWEIAKGTLHIVDASESEVANGKINQPYWGTINTGTCISLPITDNTVYPNIAGLYANGYSDFYIQTAAANPFEGPFTFKFLSNKVIDPAFVTLAGGMHGLRFDLMTPTTLAAHAGNDQTICAGQSVPIGGNPTATGGTPNYSYNWTPTAGLNDATVANPIASPAATMIYTVEVTDATGCKARDEITVTVDPSASCVSCISPPSGLINWWPGECGANDIQGGKHGMFQGNATIAAGLVGNAFSFDGNSDYVSLPQNNDWNFGTGDFTVEFWEISSNNAARMHALSFEPNYGVSNLDFDFNDPDTEFGLWVYWNSGGGNSIKFGARRAYTDGHWHHIALTRTGSTMTLYVDGFPVGSTSYSAAIDLSNSNRNYIGAGLVGAGNEFFWDGLVDEASIYNHSLSGSEILSIYNARSAGKCRTLEPPVADAGSDQTINAGETVQIGGSPTASGGNGGPYTISWSPTTGLDNPSAANPNASPTSSTTYTVTVTENATGCKATDQVVLTVDLTNLALNKTVTASSSRPGYPPGNTVDGNTNTHWRSDAVNGSINAWLRVDLAAVYTIGRVVINWSGSFYARKYTVQVSLTDGNWTTVYTDNAGNGGVDNITFAATTARYVRVFMTKHYEQIERIDEFEIYAASGPLQASDQLSVTGDQLSVTSYQVEQNYPNPFNPSTVISFQLPENSEVKLAIYSLTGQLVRELANGEMNAGRHAISWDGGDRVGNTVAAGMYLYRLVALGENGEAVFTQTRRMAFVK